MPTCPAVNFSTLSCSFMVSEPGAMTSASFKLLTYSTVLFTGGLERAQDFPIYLIHGALDWMFPVYTARMGRDALLSAGARLVYREIEDLSHTYPRDENPKILDWLMKG